MTFVDEDKKGLFLELVKQEVAYLGLTLADGYPRVVPVNFVAIGEDIYFHGSLKGEKHDILAQGGKVSMTIAEALSVVPAHWYSDRGCGANHFFQSVTIFGKASVVDDIPEKAQVLEVLNVKYIPEGGYLKITVDEPYYQKPLKYTGVFKISPEKITFRCNIGETYNEEKKSRLGESLLKRNSEVDKLTLERIKGTSK